jgi:hypothetical protein
MTRELHTRSAVAGMSTENPDALTPSFRENEFLSRALERSVLGRMAYRPVPFYANLVTSPTGAAASFVAEGHALGVTNMVLTASSLRPLKFGAVMVGTDAWFRWGGGEQVITSDLAVAMANALNSKLLDVGNAGDDVTPASITNGVTPQETWFDTFANFTGDLERSVWIARPEMWTALQSNMNSDVGLRDGTFKNAPALSTRYAPEDAVILLDPSGLSVALGQIEVDTSREGDVVFDTAPSVDVGGLDSPPDSASAAQVVSLWETDSVAVRTTAYANWSMGAGRIAMIVFGSPGSPA